MSWLDGIADEADLQNQRDAIQIGQPGIEPGFFTGSIDATGNGLVKGIVKTSAMVEDAIKSTHDVTFEDGTTGERVNPQANQRKVDLANSVKLLTPDANEVGTAGEILHTLSDVIPRTALGYALGGPAGGAVLAGAPEYGASAAVAESEGIDPATAKLKGGIDAAVLGIGSVLPGGNIFKNLLLDFGVTVGANVGLGVASRAATSELLESNGYTAQAEQYKAFDATAMTVDAVLGAAFHGVSRLTHKAPAVVDAALTENAAQHLAADTSPGAPVDPKSNALHQQSLEETLKQIVNGEPVQVNARMSEATFIRKDAAAPIVSKGAMAHFNTVKAASEATGVDSNILIAQIDAESGGKVDAVSPAGAQGVSQFMPKTAKQYGVDVADPVSSINGQARYMADLRKMFEGDNSKALAAYNWGQGNVSKAIKKFGDKWLDHAPRETRNYVTKILARARVGKPSGDKLAIRMAEQPEVVKQEYNQLPGTDGGRILNTDEARELSPEYREDRTKSADVHEPASQFIKDLYADKLAEPTPVGRQPIVLFTAGGTGAGKSTGALRTAEGVPLHQAAEIIYDTNMNTLRSSIDKIEMALEAGRNVAIQYVYRDPVESLVAGALPRAMRMGRTVPLDAHEATHVGVSKTIRLLQEKYKDDPRVDIFALDNTHGKGNSRPAQLDDLPVLTENDSLKERLSEALESEYQAGRISEAVYLGTKEQYSKLQGNGSEDGRSNSSQSEQSHPQHQVTDPAATHAADNQALPETFPELQDFIDNIPNVIARLDNGEVLANLRDGYRIQKVGDNYRFSAAGKADFPTVELDVAELSSRLENTYKSADDAQKSQATASTPEMNTARQAIEADPSLRVTLDDGSEVSAQEAMAMIDEELAQAESDSKAYDAAVTCFMRTE
jgi:soluble lytic murein transglycosylase-like protein